ncbi:hypothetical protein SBD_0096 [Streptomyces bottropensis ATCC 25435]|uniref:Uncharacterized protein n=1 Tax=Streptomyces bottropensis ATCC 25435 TaxID=1054862 RepID=M3FYR7_9ACTN|nr:hypothetical protein SBD_0096 [Streptomyces bottropensis ATCC 25435]
MPTSRLWPRAASRTFNPAQSQNPAPTEFLGPVTEPVLEDQVVAAGHGLEQLRAHGRFGGEAGRAARDGEGGANAAEQRVGVERGGVEPLSPAAGGHAGGPGRRTPPAGRRGLTTPPGFR